jgi:hypothetical protein
LSIHGKELNQYARIGLRTTDAWQSLGREVMPGSEPRAESLQQGKALPLFSREQTTPKAKRGSVATA